MKAVVCTRYGTPEVLKLAEVPKPVPLDNEVLIRIHATTCHIGDVRVRGAILPLWMQVPFRLYMGILKPKRPILGLELAGVVEAAGRSVRRFKAGDAVLASSGITLGGHAEYICLPEDATNIRKGLVVHKPAGMSFGEAAAGLATGGLTAPAGMRLDMRKDAGLVAKMTTADLQFLAELVDAGQLRTFIDREYPLERIVEAHAYVQQEHKRGHVVIHASSVSEGGRS